MHGHVKMLIFQPFWSGFLFSDFFWADLLNLSNPLNRKTLYVVKSCAIIVSQEGRQEGIVWGI